MEHEHCDTLWICGTCRKEFELVTELINHYRDMHEGDSDSEIDFTERVADDKKDNA